MHLKLVPALATALLLAGCSSYTVSGIKPAEGSAAVQRVPTNPAHIIVTERDITDKRYDVLGDIDLSVNKTTILNQDPTKQSIDAALRERAAALGADAVILVRYGTVGISFWSWGTLDGKGRAVAFRK